MRCPSLSELPLPPAGKTGWPWTEESPQLSDSMPDGSPWPRVSIVTPSYNQAQFIEETIRSVLLQGYPNLEYIIIDGGSTDGSVGIVRKYEPWLAHWVSEPDKGQSDALNKGFRRATGSIVAWLNSDDYYLPNILPERVAEFVHDPELVLVYGDCHRVDKAGECINTWKTGQCTPSSLLLDGNQIPQQSTLMRAAALTAIGGIDRNLHYVMDFALWLRLSLVGKFRYVQGPVANFRKHMVSKGLTAGYAFFVERLTWLSEWEDLGRILADSERAEMFRRQHVLAALHAIFEGKETAAASHFGAALQDGVWPYGNVDTLARKIVHFGGTGGHTMQDSWERYETLKRVLRLVEPTRMSRWLHRHVASQYHILWAFRNYRTNGTRIARGHLLKGVWHDPRWLGDRSVLYHSVGVLLGWRVADWLRRIARRVTKRYAG
jgi:glycosyltransferase involved in cell wall biosynthesis